VISARQPPVGSPDASHSDTSAHASARSVHSVDAHISHGVLMPIWQVFMPAPVDAFVDVVVVVVVLLPFSLVSESSPHACRTETTLAPVSVAKSHPYKVLFIVPSRP
jgi:hypothetical protein